MSNTTLLDMTKFNEMTDDEKTLMCCVFILQIENSGRKVSGLEIKEFIKNNTIANIYDKFGEIYKRYTEDEILLMLERGNSVEQ